MDRNDWNDRYRTRELVWTAQPNRFLVAEVAGLTPGRVLDLAAGEGRNALEQGWDRRGAGLLRGGDREGPGARGGERRGDRDRRGRRRRSPFRVNRSSTSSSSPTCNCPSRTGRGRCASPPARSRWEARSS